MEQLDIKIKPRLSFTLKKCGDVVPYGITPEERAKLAGIEENANDYTHPETHPASILDVVDVVNGSANKFFNERGEMVAVATSSIGVTGSQLYASTANSDVAGYKSLVGTPQPLETEIILTAKSSDGIVWGAKYLSVPFTEAVTIPTTAYGFDYWRKVSAANGTSRKHLRVFLYRAGVETNIITPLASPDIEETEFTERQISYIFPELVLLAGDRIGIQEGFSTTHANNVTLTYIVGDGRGWFMRLPLPLKHENLTDKNSEAAVQHVDITVTKETLDEADKVALYDSVTGKVVLTPKSNLQSANSNLLYQYVHSGNKEVYISAIDYLTHTFTSVGHGLANGDRLTHVTHDNGQMEKVFPFALNYPIDATGWYVINATSDTFQISSTSGGSAVPTIDKATQNFTKWRFEVINSINMLFENIPALGCNLEIIGNIPQVPKFIFLNGYNNPPAIGYTQKTSTTQGEVMFHILGNIHRGYYFIKLMKTPNSISVIRKWGGFTINSATLMNSIFGERYDVYTENVTDISKVLLYVMYLNNGTIINVLKR